MLAYCWSGFGSGRSCSEGPGPQTKVTDANNKVTTHHFDRQGRVTRVVDALGHERKATYDANSNVIDRTSAMSNKSLATFDADNNLKSSTLPTGASTTMDYDDPAFKHFPTKVTNPQGNALNLDYDPKGNLETVTDAMPTPGVSRQTYNADGTPATSTDARGKVTTFGYDPEGNLTGVTPPAPLGATAIVPDGLSRRSTVTDAKGQVSTTTYDVLDRVTQVSIAGGPSVTFRYDPGGRLFERIDATGTTTYLYDSLNRMREERLPGGATNAYTYDPVGNLKSVTDAGGTLYYDYNDVNLVRLLTEPGGNLTTFAYDEDNNRKQTNYPNGVVQSATYDGSSRLTLIEGKRGTTTLTRFAYTYTMPGTTIDTALRRTLTDKDNNITTYGYDKLDRLESAVTKSTTGTTTDSYAYAYDAAGNRTSDTANGVATPAYFNDADQLTSRGATGYSYDANGNQTGSSAGQALAYNAADQTTSLTKAGGSPLPAAYAGLSQVERTTAGPTTFTNTLLGVTAASEAGMTTATTRDPAGGLVGLRSGTNRSYYLFDGLGSVAAVTNSLGAITNSYAYDPYGVTTESKLAGAVNNPWRYAGQYQDAATGLYKMGARYYQPELGRWTQPDPSGAEANAYLYVGGNPVNFVDPSGLFSIKTIVDAIDRLDDFADVLTEVTDEDGLRGLTDELADFAFGFDSLPLQPVPPAQSPPACLPPVSEARLSLVFAPHSAQEWARSSVMR